MSDRMRGSVRTGARDGDESADGAPETATPVAAAAPDAAARPDGAATPAGASGAAKAPAAGTSGPAKAPAAGTRGAAKAPAAGASGPAKAAAAAGQGRAEKAPQPARPAGPSPAIDGTQVITPDSPPSGVFAAGASAGPAAPAADGPARAAAPAGSSSGLPASPLVPPPGAPAPQRPGRVTGTRAPAAAAPAAPPVGIDGTQAVPVVAAGNRPAAAPARPAGGAAAAGAAAATATRGRGRAAGRGPRRARLQLRHIDTWSALKISLVVSIALFFVWMVAVGILYGVLSGLGVFQTLNDLIGQLSTASGSEAASSGVISAKVVLGGAAVIGAINIVLLTALCTVSAFVYNLCSDLVGGLEVTLAERE
jgi:Transmembrane domain of unknown function (DUF3566)